MAELNKAKTEKQSGRKKRDVRRVDLNLRMIRLSGVRPYKKMQKKIRVKKNLLGYAYIIPKIYVGG